MTHVLTLISPKFAESVIFRVHDAGENSNIDRDSYSDLN